MSKDKNALAALREKHADKIEEIFLTMYGIVTSKGAADKDKINAGKVAASVLGTPRPAAEKEPVTKKGTIVTEKDTVPDPEEMADIYDKLGI